MPTITFLTSSFWTYAGGTAKIQVWGAGGRGNINGNGGSGGGYAESTIALPAGTYTASVGLCESASFYSGSSYLPIPTGSVIPNYYTDGSASFFAAGSVALVSAAGGRYDGTTTAQSSSLTGSITFQGGAGGNYTYLWLTNGVDSQTGIVRSEYGNLAGSGGGGSAGPSGSGASGSVKGAHGNSGPGGGFPGVGSVGYGGAGSYYYYGPTAGIFDGVQSASRGSIPGGGGGGSWAQGLNTDTSMPGGSGQITITY